MESIISVSRYLVVARYHTDMLSLGQASEFPGEDFKLIIWSWARKVFSIDDTYVPGYKTGMW
jgi:hypothetical protein